MPSITALLHTENDALRLGRALETLYPCDDIVVVDHGSRDATVRVACEYGARVMEARPGAPPGIHFLSSGSGWIFCLSPRESLTESLAASLFEWKAQPVDTEAVRAFSVYLREETASGWIDLPAAETRLVPQAWKRWERGFPIHEPSAVALEGGLLRFVFP